mgnify:CR=1 FL=1
MVDFQCKNRYSWEDFLEIIRLLRSPGGCPWDAEQTHLSIRRDFLEETYEVLDALDRDDARDMCEELGDVLMQVLFHAQIEREQGRFDVNDVIDGIAQKMVFRHPHVFGTTEVENATQVSENWEQLKLKEKGGNKRVLSGVPSGLPSIVKAYRIQEKARNVGFEWDDASGAWDKLLEEMEELKVELERGNHDLAEAVSLPHRNCFSIRSEE